MKVLKPIGGEPWFDINLFDSSLDNFKDSRFTFTSGGQSSINFIVKQIGFGSDEFVLLPSYLCPTIVWNLERNNINFDFYKVNRDLSIDIEDLEKKLSERRVKAVFYIDYFGFFHGRESLEYLVSLRGRGIALVEDAVQMLWFSNQAFTGDYVFNSYRKFLPVDGSLVISDIREDLGERRDDYYKYQNMARMKLTAYVMYGLGTMDDFVRLFSKAEEVYGKTTEADGMPDISRYLLNRVDADRIGTARRSNYGYLEEKLAGDWKIKQLLPKERLGGNIPIGFPVLVEDRDRIKRELRERSIYCPAHWPILNEGWVEDFEDSIYLAQRILTLPVDQRYSREDMDKLLFELRSLCI